MNTSYTTCHNDKLGSTVDDLSVDDLHVDNLPVDDLSADDVHICR